MLIYYYNYISMDDLYYQIWLADGLKPKETESYYLTSRGLASKDKLDKKQSRVFLNINQLDNKNTYYYDSSYTIYKIESKYYFNNNRIIDIEESKSGELYSVEYKDSFISYLINKESIYLFEFEGQIYNILYTLYKKYKFKYIYSKNLISIGMSPIRFYFVGTRLSNNDVFLNEFMNNYMIGDVKNNYSFKSGVYEYKKDYLDNINSFPIFMYTHSAKESKNYASKIDIFEFINIVSQISEFSFDDKYYSEISDYLCFGGSLYKIRVNNKTIGCFAIARNATTFIYIECVGIFKKYRKRKYKNKLYSTYLIDSIKYISNQYKKNAILTIENNKLTNFYINNGFKIVGKFFFD